MKNVDYSIHANQLVLASRLLNEHVDYKIKNKVILIMLNEMRIRVYNQICLTVLNEIR
jgi:hypothetical protein